MASFKVRLHRVMDRADAPVPRWLDRQWLYRLRQRSALKTFSTLVADYPNEPQARFEMAMILANLDRDAEAIAQLETALRLDPNYPGARSWLARLHASAGRYLVAANYKLEELTATQPGDWSANGAAWADCADNFLDAGEPAQALEVLERYFEKYEGRLTGYETYRPAPYRMRAKALLALHRAEEALTAVQIACADPNSVPADALTRVAVLVALRREHEARAAFASLSTFEGTQPYDELLAYAKSLNVDLQ